LPHSIDTTQGIIHSLESIIEFFRRSRPKDTSPKVQEKKTNLNHGFKSLENHEPGISDLLACCKQGIWDTGFDALNL